MSWATEQGTTIPWALFLVAELQGLSLGPPKQRHYASICPWWEFNDTRRLFSAPGYQPHWIPGSPPRARSAQPHPVCPVEPGLQYATLSPQFPHKAQDEPPDCGVVSPDTRSSSQNPSPSGKALPTWLRNDDGKPCSKANELSEPNYIPC